MTIGDISKPVKNHINEFTKYFKGFMQSDVSLLNLIIKYLTQKTGKQVRPTLVFLSAEVAGGVNRRSYVGAAMVELIHTATLVHDDVVDDSKERRGIATINSEWNNKIAVLIGDFILAKGLLSAVENDEFRFLAVTSSAVRRMSEAELLAIEKSNTLNVDEATYFRITADKTASLLASCCEVGAMSATDDPAARKAMRDYGENLGIAFQIRDDVFDYVSRSSTIGKPVGNDLKEKKITLPLIYSFEHADSKKSKEILKLVKNGKLTKSDISGIIDFVRESGGIDYAEQKARDYAQRARGCLDYFPDSEARRALMNFTDFVIERSL